MNKLQDNLIKHIFLFLVLSFSAVSVSAGEHVLIPKLGAIAIKDNTNHRVDNNSFDLEDDNVPGLGFSYLYKLDNGFAFGVDVFGYEKDIVTTVNNTGDANIGHVYAVAEKFFNNDGTVKPYIGIGLGAAAIGFDANVNGAIADDYNDTAYGFSYEFFAGVEVGITEKVGMMFEYKHFNIDIDDDIGLRDISFESDGDALFVGVSIHI